MSRMLDMIAAMQEWTVTPPVSRIRVTTELPGDMTGVYEQAIEGGGGAREIVLHPLTWRALVLARDEEGEFFVSVQDGDRYLPFGLPVYYGDVA